MANVFNNGRKFKVSANGTYYLGPASEASTGTIAVMIVNSGTAVGASITVKSLIMGPDAQTDTVAPVPVLYVSRYLNGGISTDGLLSTAITPASGSSLILIPASGQVAVLDVASLSSGSFTVYTFPLWGAA